MKKIVFLILMLLLCGCQNKTYTEINYDKLYKKMNSYEDYILLIGKDNCEACKSFEKVIEKIVEEQKIREKAFADYQVNERLMDLAHPDCLFMHCLPAHRGEEISENMLDHKNAVVWDEAENRLHAQKALVEFLLNENLKKD